MTNAERTPKLENGYVHWRLRAKEAESRLKYEQSRRVKQDVLIAELEAENAKLREALEFYADRENYLSYEGTDGEIGDWGDLARRALGEGDQ